MPRSISLNDYLDQLSARKPALSAVAETITALVTAGRKVSDLLSAAGLVGDLAEIRRGEVAGDSQKKMDWYAQEFFLSALASVPVKVIASEEMDDPIPNDPLGTLAVALDPLDGSSNIDTNAPVGSIFSILPALPGDASAETFRQTGRAQLAAGFLIYGPQTSLIVSFGDGTSMFTLDRESGEFYLASDRMRVPEETKEYAINASNYRHWEEPVRHYVDDCLRGAEGPRGHDFNTRWIASMVAEAYRILIRGGIYLYPGDTRTGYHQGRLRLVYEGNPVAMLVEQAGGKATDGHMPILDHIPTSIHQRIPLIFGSRGEVACLEQYYEQPDGYATRSPLFGHRSLFRA